MAPGGLYQPNWHVRAISVPGPDTDLSLYVSFDNARFLFGCGEGTQRAFTQKKLSMRGLAAVFVGTGEAKSRAGLAGVLMTAADAGLPKVDIIGPPDISHYLGTLRSSVGRDSLTVQMHSFPRDKAPGEAVEIFKSPNLTVEAIALSPSAEAGPSTPPNYDPYEPSTSAFRPSRLSPLDVQRWCDTVVGDMFQNGPKARASRRPPSPPPSSSMPYSPSPPANPYLNSDGSIHAGRSDTRAPLPVSSRADVETEVVYICQAPDIRGKFDVAKSNALGVPKGPARGQLSRGESIEVDDATAPGGKRLIKPEDCLVGGGPGAILIVVNCSERNVESLLQNPAFHKYQPNVDQVAHTAVQHVHLIVHRVPSTVWQDQRYRNWMAAFGDQTQHLIADTAISSKHTVFNSAAWNTLQLSLLDDTIFTPPYVSASNPSLDNALPPNTSFLVPNHRCQMHPPAKLTFHPNYEKDVPFLVTAAQGEEARAKIRQDLPEYAEACDAAKAAVLADPRNTDPPASKPGDDIVVTTLGTGSALPSKYRNVSATHLDVPGVGGILLDAGEGTLGQFRRRFGEDGMKRIHENLGMVFISHMHADHHLGLAALLEDRFKHGISSPLHIVAPPFIGLHLQESASWQYPATQEGLENLYFINIFRLGFRVMTKGESYVHDGSRSPEGLGEGGPVESWEQEALEDTQRGARRWPLNYVHGYATNANREHWRSVRKLQNDLGLTSIWAPLVPHRGKAYGLALEHSSGWKIVYSGDTKPSDALIEAGQDATLLIHEATLEDDKPEIAAQKGHSTFGQAIDVGKRMKARHILLNHFSQRYPKLPKLPTPTASTGDRAAMEPVVSISFDFMSLRVGDMWKMAHYMDAMSMLFAEVDEDGEGDGDGSVLDAVVGDVNPSIVGGEVNGQKSKGKGKGGIPNGNSGSRGGGIVEGEPKKSKRAMKREAQKAAGQIFESHGNGNAPIIDGKRPCSPSNPGPELKKTKSDATVGESPMDVDDVAQ